MSSRIFGIFGHTFFTRAGIVSPGPYYSYMHFPTWGSRSPFETTSTPSAVAWGMASTALNAKDQRTERPTAGRASDLPSVCLSV
jgi:hypothetical protein